MIRYLVFNLLLNCYPCVPRRPSRWHGKLSSSSNSTLTAACGQATTVLENPWAAILYYEGSFQCGATILEDQLAITAAHCINGLHKDDFTLYYGRTFQPDSGIEDQGHRRFGGQTGILAWRIHPRYNVFDKFEGNDIALLKLKRKIQFNDFVRPIKVVPTHHKYDIMYDRARIVNLAGFGQTKGPLDSTNPDDWPDQMQLVEQKIVPEQRCNRGNDTFHFGPPQDGLCTRLKCEPNGRQGIQAKFKQICPGDSGSGIVQHFVEDNTFYLLAVVSYTVAHGKRECGLSKKPALSIKTRDHRDFIYEDFFPYKRSKQNKVTRTSTTPLTTTQEASTSSQSLVLTGGQPNNGRYFSSSEIITNSGVCIPQNIPPLPQEISIGRSIWINNTLIFCGGGPNNQPVSKNCWSLQPGMSEWSGSLLCGPVGCGPQHRNDMNYARTYFTLTVVKNDPEEVVAAGGIDYTHDGSDDPDHLLDSIEMYSFAKSTWITLNTKLPHPRFGHCAVHYYTGAKSYLIIIGGTYQKSWNPPTDSVIKIDLESGKVSSLSNLPEGLWRSACTTQDGYIYVSGGKSIYGISSKVYAYNLKSNEWSHQGDLNTGRCCHIMGTTGAKEMVISGGYSSYFLASVEASRDGGKTWIVRDQSLEEPREFAAMAEVPDHIFACT